MNKVSNAALLTGTSQNAGTRRTQSPASAVWHFNNSATYSGARTFPSPSVFKYSRQTLSLHRLCQQLTDGQQNVLQVDKEDTGAANALPAAGKHPERTCNAQESFPSTFTGGFTLPATCVSLPEHESDDDSYEVLDLTEYARRHHWWNRVFGRNSGPIVEKYSVATQIVMGGVTGWCAGFLFQKVGKLAATAVGGGFLLLQIASHSGYVQVDWKRVEKDVNKAKKQLKKRANKAAPEINTLIEESTEFIKQNIVVSSGFVGGFLLGLAS
ncbi:PREDICTED: FUN14 domain-containing protein 1 [Charadrius vociferus]|uniref:FUN14 domain-containing protein 1 n=1 Tax=Charadrius vociferus TaxID=50402 RepID=UPI000521AC8D|nr:PREDICTED: FUN14 domain-containing protein 1 [Charadrius vociferus]